MLKYSVLMSVYKQVKISEFTLSIDSMINQTVSPDEIIVVVDGPILEDLRSVLDSYKEKYIDMITIVNLEKNQGLAVALNAGLVVCRNEIVARMDSDDFSLPKRCELQLKALMNDSEIALIGTQMKTFMESPEHPNENYIVRPCNYEDIKNNFKRNNPLAHPSVMFKKSVVLAVGGYDPILVRRQDYDLFSKIVGQGYKAINLEEPLLHFRTDENFWLRNKNKVSCLSKIEVAKRIYKRGECSFVDYMYTYLTMRITLLIPKAVYTKLYQIFRKV